VNVLHRDIKSANVFMCKNGQVKLGDFNVAKEAKMGLLKTQTGTPYYASPEIWKDEPYGTKSDIWSLGVVLYEIMALQTPFQGSSMSELYKKVIRGVFPRPPDIYSDALKNLVRAMLSTSP
jgi:NIMA (never in mitosis gene a)-related kinase